MCARSCRNSAVDAGNKVSGSQEQVSKELDAQHVSYSQDYGQKGHVEDGHLTLKVPYCGTGDLRVHVLWAYQKY